MGKKIKVDHTKRKEFAAFMKGQRLYKTDIVFEDPLTGTEYEIPIEYEQATAFDLAAIYSDLDPNAGPEEQFEYSTDLFNFCVKYRGATFVNCEKGQADYGAGEISIRDLTLGEKQKLEILFTPGMGKSGEQLERKLKADSRKAGKGVRGRTTEVDEPTSPGISL